MLDLYRREAIGLHHAASAIILTAVHMPAASRRAVALHRYALDLRKHGRALAHQAGHELPVVPEPHRRKSRVVPVLPESEIRRQEAVALRHVAAVMRSVADVLPSVSVVMRDLYLDADDFEVLAAELAEHDPRQLPTPPNPPATMPLPTDLAA